MKKNSKHGSATCGYPHVNTVRASMSSEDIKKKGWKVFENPEGWDILLMCPECQEVFINDSNP
jgi:hypothetical protein